MNRTDRGRPRTSPRCEPMPTPGVAPRGRVAREPQEACRGPTARAAPDARSGHPDPPRRPTTTRSTTGLDAARPDPDRGGAGRDRRSRPPAPRLDRGDQPDRRSASPAAVAVAHVIDSLTGLAVLREHGADRSIDLGSGGGYPGIPLAAAYPAARALLLEPDRQEGALPVGRQSPPRASRTRSRPRRSGPRRWPPIARHRGRWPAVVARAVAPLPELVELAVPLLAPGGCLVAWKRGDIARRAGRRGPGARRARWRVDRRPRRARPGPRRPSPRGRHRARRRARRPTRATPPRGAAGRGD